MSALVALVLKGEARAELDWIPLQKHQSVQSPLSEQRTGQDLLAEHRKCPPGSVQPSNTVFKKTDLLEKEQGRIFNGNQCCISQFIFFSLTAQLKPHKNVL